VYFKRNQCPLCRRDRWPHRDGKGYGVKLDFIPRSPDVELVIRAIEPKPAAAGAA
jgi:hypothetical protein